MAYDTFPLTISIDMTMVAGKSSHRERAMSSSSKDEVLNAFLHDLCFWGELSPPNRPTDDDNNNNTSNIREPRQLEGASGSYCTEDSSLETRTPQTLWKTAVDPVTGRTYYYDNISRITQWEKVGCLFLRLLAHPLLQRL